MTADSSDDVCKRQRPNTGDSEVVAARCLLMVDKPSRQARLPTKTGDCQIKNRGLSVAKSPAIGPPTIQKPLLNHHQQLLVSSKSTLTIIKPSDIVAPLTVHRKYIRPMAPSHPDANNRAIIKVSNCQRRTLVRSR